MPTGVWNLEWLNHNSQRSYPLAEDATMVDVTGTFTLPTNFILGLYFPVGAGSDVDVEQFYIQSISVFATGYNISIGYYDGVTNPVVASAIINQSTHVPNTSYALAGVYPFDDSVGKIVIGILDSINLQPTGQFIFDYQGGKLDSDAVRPMIRGVQSIRVLNNGELSVPMTGHVVLAAGDNFQITMVRGDGINPSVITFSAVDSTGLTEVCPCEGTPGQPILTINGIPPTAEGAFALVSGTCMDIAPISNGLQLNDTCSSPCCGCAELEQITQELQLLSTGEQTLDNFVSQLAAQINNFSQVILGSRLGDQGCLQC